MNKDVHESPTADRMSRWRETALELLRNLHKG